MKRMWFVLAVAALAALAAAGCSNKKLIAQKDTEIANLNSELSRLQSEVAEQKRMNEELQGQLADLEGQKKVWLDEKQNLTHITLDGSATFGDAKASLTRDGKEVLDRVWSVLQNYPNRAVLIEGHADNRAIAPDLRWKYASNWELSSARANSVLHYLQEKYNLESGRLAAVGYGDTRPVADNSTAEGRAQNRRVVITVGSAQAVQARLNNP